MKKRIGWGAALALSAALVCGAAIAQDASGAWHGMLSLPNGPMFRVGLTLMAKAGGGYEGTLASPDQGAAEFKLRDAKVENGKLSFAVPAMHGTYSGHWEAARKAWVGEWTQGAPLPLVLTAGKP